MTLYKQSLEASYSGFLSKAQIIQHGKHLVNSSFTKPDPGSRYTAWSSMRTLISKNLVSKCSHPPKFTLTEEGAKLAKKLYENSATLENNNDKVDDNRIGNVIPSDSVDSRILNTEESPKQGVSLKIYIGSWLNMFIS